MTRSPLHQPPPPSIVDALVRQGLSEETVLAMERWKAIEVLELLQTPVRGLAPARPQRSQPA